MFTKELGIIGIGKIGSVLLRKAISNRVENEVIHFAKGCLERGNEKDARKVLGKVATIIPQSREIDKLLKQLKY